MLRVRAPAERAFPQDTALVVPVVRHPARPGHKRREEHPCRWSSGSPHPCGRCLRS
jgi:hypothetical protein